MPPSLPIRPGIHPSSILQASLEEQMVAETVTARSSTFLSKIDLQRLCALHGTNARSVWQRVEKRSVRRYDKPLPAGMNLALDVMIPYWQEMAAKPVFFACESEHSFTQTAWKEWWKKRDILGATHHLPDKEPVRRLHEGMRRPLISAAEVGRAVATLAQCGGELWSMTQGRPCFFVQSGQTPVVLINFHSKPSDLVHEMRHFDFWQGLTAELVSHGMAPTKAATEAAFLMFSAQGILVTESLSMIAEMRRHICDYLENHTWHGDWPVTQQELSAKFFLSTVGLPGLSSKLANTCIPTEAGTGKMSVLGKKELSWHTDPKFLLYMTAYPRLKHLLALARLQDHVWQQHEKSDVACLIVNQLVDDAADALLRDMTGFAWYFETCLAEMIAGAKLAGKEAQVTEWQSVLKQVNSQAMVDLILSAEHYFFNSCPRMGFILLARYRVLAAENSTD